MGLSSTAGVAIRAGRLLQVPKIYFDVDSLLPSDSRKGIDFDDLRHHNAMTEPLGVPVTTATDGSQREGPVTEPQNNVPGVESAADTIDDNNDAAALEVDDNDSAFTEDTAPSDTTSLASSLIRGHIENGRKYNGLRDDYWGPSDDQQFETMDAGHFVYLLHESHRPNPLFKSPVKDPKYILDIGTGPGSWAIDVADKFPDATVNGVDLFPPPHSWVPPNCFLEVEDVLQDWTWKYKFDLIHMRLMLGAFTDSEWDSVYRQCFDNLKPGGWIEEVELDVRVMCDDGTLPADSYVCSWGANFLGCAERSGRSLATQTTMARGIERAGFVNVHNDLFKCPIGAWPKNRTLKEMGRVNFDHWSSGLDGWAMWLLTKYGAPKPWDADEVRVYVAKVRSELLNNRWHIYHLTRRVWAQKPF